MLLRSEIVTPTPIQEQAIPVAIAGGDVVGIAQTGTGKTLAFGLPLIARLQPGKIGLVLAPTRELAQQIADTFHKLNVRTLLIVGGASMNMQVRALRGSLQVIVATPGRLMDHMGQGTLRLNNVQMVVLDEADRMFDMGFAPAIHRILEATPKARQTMLFSATMPREISDLAANYLVNPKRVEVAKPNAVPELVKHELIYLGNGEKPAMLANLLYENKGTVLVFARTRHGARKLAKAIRMDGHTAAELHSDRTLNQRREALHGFKTGAYRILVATDIAARGIDVKDISLVINHDVPENPEDYIHRIGRTGRAGAHGRAVTLALPDQAKDIHDIERILGTGLNLSELSTVIPNQVRAHFRSTPTRQSKLRPAEKFIPKPSKGRYHARPSGPDSRPGGLFGQNRRGR